MTPSAPRIFFTLLAMLASVMATAQSPSPSGAAAEIRIEPNEVSAGGSQRALVELPSFGRYALWAESDRGVAVQLVDRMAGPGRRAGEAGAENGRIDLFLDRGDYLLRTFGAENAEGAAKIRVEPFVELEPEPVQWVDLRLVETELGDLQQRSWWLRIDKQERLTLEAAGRHLNDLRLWRDGSWLVDQSPTFETIEPRPGQPLRMARLSTMLNPGLYRITAYGGPGVPWTEDDGARPLYVRSGVPKGGEAARRRVEISPFGFDRLVVPGRANYFRVETAIEGPAGESVELEVAWWDSSSPFAGGGDRAAITKENRFPVAEVEGWSGDDEKRWRIVTWRGQAGESLLLQHFRSVAFYPYRKRGSYLISTVSSGPPGDSIDASAVMVARRHRSNGQPVQVLRSRPVRLEHGLEWRRRFNLPSPATLHLHVEEAGRYEIRGGGDASARIRVAPFFAPGTEPKDYEPPPFRDDGDIYDMSPGFYLLTLEPRQAGILTLAIRGLESPPQGQELGAAPPPQSIAFFGPVELEQREYTVFLNQRPSVRSGLILRRLPIDLERSLPLVADSTAPLTIPGRARRAGLLTALAEDGTALEVSIDGGPWQRQAQVEGEFKVAVRPPPELDLPAAYDLAVLPEIWRPTAPLPPMPAEKMELPEFPVLEPDAPQRFDVHRGGRETFLLRADRAALYRLESTGLLDLEGTVRTRVVPDLERRSTGGSGRNFAVQRYLGPGDYQLTVATRGASHGRAGVVLATAPLIDGGELREGLAVRSWLDAGEARGYRFEVQEAGRFRLRSFGLAGNFRVRLEDAEGWPLIKPGRRGNLTVELDPGIYRLVVLPQEVKARQVTLLERVEEPAARSGHGPFELTLGQKASHRWLEPEQDGAEREPDRWRFELPADAEVTVTLGEGMEGTVHELGGEEVASVRAGRTEKASLQRGAYELRTRSARRDNRVDYDVLVESTQLLAGQRRRLQAPGELEIRVGEPALVELSSFGRRDVRARLLTLDGELLAASDDRPGDWNFRLARRLDAGAYRLVVEAVATGGETSIEMKLPPVVDESLWTLTRRAEPRWVTPGDGAVRVPIQLPPGADLFLASFESPENVRVALEIDGRSVVEEEGRRGEIWLPMAPAGDVVLRVDSLDQSGNRTRLEAAAITAKRLSEADAASVRTKRVPALGGRGVVAIDLERSGCFKVSGRRDGVESSPGLGGAPSPLAGVASGRDVLWLAAPGGQTLRLKRHRLEAGAGPTRVLLPAGGEAMCDVEAAGPAWVRAAGLGAPVSVSFDPEYGRQALAGQTALIFTGVSDSDASDSEASDSQTSASQASEPPSFSRPLRLKAGDGGDLEVDVEVRAARASATFEAPWGRSEHAVGVGTATNIELPAGAKQLRISLSRGLAVEAGEAGAVWAQEAGLETRLETAASWLRVIDDAGSGGRIVLETRPAKGTPIVGLGRPFERRLPGQGRIEMRVAHAGGPARLKVLGAEATVLYSDGAIRRGRDLPLAESPGRLMLDYSQAPGDLVMAWVEPADSLGNTPFQVRAPSRGVEPPTRLNLEGPGAAFDVELEKPGVLSIRSSSPALSIVERGDGTRRHAVHAEFLSLDLALDVGKTRIHMRGLAGEALRGDVSFDLSEIEVLGEGLGPEVLLGSGESRFFAVDVVRPSAVGFGVDAEADVVKARLLDSSGSELGRGVAQMHDLEAGRYLFVLTLPAERRPVRVRPAVVGLTDPGTGPPRQVLERYLKLAGAAP